MEKTKFAKGDYIVLLYRWNSGSTSDGFVMNHIYKQNNDSDILYPEKFCNDFVKTEEQIGQQWTNIKYVSKDDWRYSTEEEMRLYDSIGKPYDTTIENPHSLIPTESYQIF